MSTKTGCGCIVLATIAIVWLMVGVGRSGKASDPGIQRGDIVTLSVGSGKIPLGVTKEDAGRITDLMLAKDALGVYQMAEQGRAILVDSGTRARIIGSSMTLYEVRIEAGPMLGESGWLPREFAKRSR